MSPCSSVSANVLAAPFDRGIALRPNAAGCVKFEYAREHCIRLGIGVQIGLEERDGMHGTHGKARDGETDQAPPQHRRRSVRPG